MMYDWDGMKPTILDLYVRQDLPLKEVENIMREEYGFHPCTRAYRAKFKLWNIHKYLKHDNASYARNPPSGAQDLSPEHAYSTQPDMFDRVVERPVQDRRHDSYVAPYGDAYDPPPTRSQRSTAPPQRSQQQESTPPRFGGMFSNLPPRQARPSSSQEQALLSPPWSPNTSSWTSSPVREPSTASQYTGLEYPQEHRSDSRRHRRGHSRVTSPLPEYGADQLSGEQFPQGLYYTGQVAYPEGYTSYSAGLPYRPAQSGRSEAYPTEDDREWSSAALAERGSTSYLSPGRSSNRDRQRPSEDHSGKGKKRSR